MSFTPGPWSVWKNPSKTQTGEGIRHMLDVHQGTPDNYGRAIANVISGGPHAKSHEYDEVMANARLIAAAPELLRELIAARTILEAIEDHCKNEAGLKGIDHADEGRRIRHGLQLFLAEPSAAIAKATSAQGSGT